MKSKSETEDNYSCKLQKDVQEIAKQELKVNSIQNILFRGYKQYLLLYVQEACPIVIHTHCIKWAALLGHTE